MEVFEKNMGSHQVINEFIRMGAKSFPKIPFEELYDLKIDPFQKNNLAKDSKYKKIKSKLSKELKNWMIDQNDFLLVESMPLIKPSLHPLDKNSKWNKVNPEFIEKLTQNDYIKLHY